MWVFVVVVIIVFVIFFNTTDLNKVRIVDNVFCACTIKPDKIYSIEELKSMLGLFDKNIYLDKFTPGVMNRGEIYYNEGKIEDYKYEDGLHICKITGTDTYDISLRFEEDNIHIKEMSCTCPHYKQGHNCKHIFALVYSLKCVDNKKKILENIEKQIVPATIAMVEHFEEYCKSNINYVAKAEYKAAMKSVGNTIIEIDKCVEELRVKTTEDTALNVLKTIYDFTYNLRNSISNILKTEKEYKERANVKQSFDAFDIPAATLGEMYVMGVFKPKENKPVNKSAFSEKEMDYYGLDEFERNLVRNGEYAPWQFEHEGTEEGDYYHYE